MTDGTRSVSKILDQEALADVVARERQVSRTIALANGLFDILHVGHVRYLEGASREADRLVVGVNSDDSARGLKGPGRPILPGSERAEIVASLACVDWVFLFDEPNVENVLLRIRPDVHCKGTDYTRDSVPERETVLSYGGRIAIVGDPKSHATRDLLREIAARFDATGRAIVAPMAPARVERRFPRHLDSLDEIFRFLDEFFEAGAIDAGARYAVRLAVEELFTNMIKYGRSGSEHVGITLERLADRVVLSLTEFDAEPFDIRHVGEVAIDRPIEERKPGGLGIHLIKRVMDRIDYEYADRCSKTTLVRMLE